MANSYFLSFHQSILWSTLSKGLLKSTNDTYVESPFCLLVFTISANVDKWSAQLLSFLNTFWESTNFFFPLPILTIRYLKLHNIIYICYKPWFCLHNCQFFDWGVHRFCLFLEGAARQSTSPKVIFSEQSLISKCILLKYLFYTHRDWNNNIDSNYRFIFIFYSSMSNYL